MKRRDLLAASLACAGAATGSIATPALGAGKTKVIAFVPSTESSLRIQKSLAGAMSALDVTVFGRSRDLELTVAKGNPGAVIAPGPTLGALGLKTTLAGRRRGVKTEPYVLVTVNESVSPESMKGHSVGILGVMNRSAMKKHCGQLLGTGVQKIKTVTKYEDLLPLLQFGSAKGVVLPKRFVSTLTSRSTLNLVQNPLPHGDVRLISVSALSSESTVVAAVKKLNDSVMASLGVDAWES